MPGIHYIYHNKDIYIKSVGIQVHSQKVFGWVWRVQVPSEKVLGSLDVYYSPSDIICYRPSLSPNSQ